MNTNNIVKEGKIDVGEDRSLNAEQHPCKKYSIFHIFKIFYFKD